MTAADRSPSVEPPRNLAPDPSGPGAAPPTLAEPTSPREPLPPTPDQGSPRPVSPTGAEQDVLPTSQGQQGAYLTTALGTRLHDTDHSLKAGPRGPVLLQDHHLREKITHFDHERIPERVVHARGAGAHGVFTSYGSAAEVTRAAFLEEGVETPVFVRFSTVLGSRGSADTVRDTRGFATKFYTQQGNFDLVGNNIPVFFIQDGIKFPDVVHAAKPHPDREIPQAQSAHDTFWDFVSLHTEAQHHTLWNMSDRGIPRSYRMMEGFGVHTFRLVDHDGQTRLVKFHWKPVLGVHSLTWEEAQLLGGADPDYHRRDLYDSIEAGAFPEWELGMQVFEDTPEQTFAGIDLLDPTKLVPEELAPVQPVGRMVLNANPSNFFAEVEQVAFHVGHLVPGIDVTDDALMQVRLFSYVDTQLTRLGGPNFDQLPVNRPHAPVNDMLRDGYGQQAVHAGVAPYRPNSLDGGCPFTAGSAEGAFVDVPKVVTEGRKIRSAPLSFDDHFSQARLFWRSMTPLERDHIVAAYTFELSRCYEEVVRERQLACLAQIDAELCASVAAGLGLPVPDGLPEVALTDGSTDVESSPALSQLGRTWPATGRMVGVVVDGQTDPDAVDQLKQALLAQGARTLVVAPAAGVVPGSAGRLVAHRTFANVTSAELDALVLAAFPAPAPDALPTLDAKADAEPASVDGRVTRLLAQSYRHAKPVGVLGQLRPADVGLPQEAPGVVTGDAAQLATGIVEHLATHRVWERFVPASATTSEGE